MCRPEKIKSNLKYLEKSRDPKCQQSVSWPPDAPPLVELMVGGVGHAGGLTNPRIWRGRCGAGYSNTGGPSLPRKRAPSQKSRDPKCFERSITAGELVLYFPFLPCCIEQKKVCFSFEAGQKISGLDLKGKMSSKWVYVSYLLIFCQDQVSTVGCFATPFSQQEEVTKFSCRGTHREPLCHSASWAYIRVHLATQVRTWLMGIPRSFGRECLPLELLKMYGLLQLGFSACASWG